MTLRRAGDPGGAGAYMAFGSLHDCMLHCETEYLKVRQPAGGMPGRAGMVFSGPADLSFSQQVLSAGCGAPWAVWIGNKKHVTG